jgi:hypothetical protein
MVPFFNDIAKADYFVLFGFRTRRTKRLVKLMETFNPI